MKPLIIEIHGTGTHNRGAELMAIAIAERMRMTFPDVRIVVSSWFGSPQDISRYGFLTHWENMGRLGMARSGLRFLQSIGQKSVINPADVDVVLDASGFSFSDQWGIGGARLLALKMNRYYRRSQPLVLLPQALGAFQDTGMARWCRKLFDRSAIVCARDQQSYSYAKPLVEDGKLRLFPDFTISVSPTLPAGLELPANFAAIVPNMRMLDKSDSAEAYLAFLRHAVDRIVSSDLVPLFLIHDATQDNKVVDLLGEKYKRFPVLTHPDPRVLKGILGQADFVIGSRFHALVSSLSQGVPCIGAGWSHKYPELFRDFVSAELLIADLSDTAQLDAAIDSLVDRDSRSAIAARVREAAGQLKARSSTMWSEVESIIMASSAARRVPVSRSRASPT